ncbi:MAG: hypothetical protein KAR38_15980, partial [Calditrichia bacterium]|nr:hypothetical protein [Calditrichia bacterium]
LIIVIFSGNMLFAQQASYSEFKAGIYNPKDAKTGWMFTYGTGKTIDEAFSWLVEFNLYKKTYNKDTKVPLPDNDILVQREIENNTYLMPLLFKLSFDKKLIPPSPFIIRGSAGIGYQFMLNKEKNNVEKEEKSRFYHGFAYQVSAGAGLEMSSSAILFAEAFYHGGKVKRDKKDVDGLPTWIEKDVSGLGFRVGINFVNFGLF